MIDGSKKRNPLVEFEFQSSHVIENRNKKQYASFGDMKISIFFVYVLQILICILSIFLFVSLLSLKKK